MTSIIHQQYLSLLGEAGNARQPDPDERLLRRMSGWPDDFRALGTWLLSEWTRSRNPRAVSDRLRELVRGRSISPTLQESVKRWNDALANWALVESMPPAAAAEPMTVAHEQYAYAKGLQKIGRSFDAAPLFLWVISDLTNYVERNPASPRVSEAIFLIGDSYLALRTLLPSGVRSDRILNLCAELCGRSVWADQSYLRWKEVMGGDA